MTTEYAAVLAQVIPVLGIAAAIELRAAAAKYVAMRRASDADVARTQSQSEDDEVYDGIMRTGAWTIVALLSMALIGLAAAENYALVAAGGGDDIGVDEDIDGALRIAVAAIFGLPIFAALSRMVATFKISRRSMLLWNVAIVVTIVAALVLAEEALDQ